MDSTVERILKMYKPINYLGKASYDKKAFYIFTEPEPKSLDSYVIFIEDFTTGNLMECSAIEALMDYGLNLNDMVEDA